MNYINLYNKLIKLTTNKSLYKNLGKQDTFNDRLVILFFHLSFLFKIYSRNTKEDRGVFFNFAKFNFFESFKINSIINIFYF